MAINFIDTYFHACFLEQTQSTPDEVPPKGFIWASQASTKAANIVVILFVGFLANI